MEEPRQEQAKSDSTARLFFGFLALSAALLTTLLLLGYLPTIRLSGTEALPSMFVGCGIGLFAALVGTVPILLSRGRPPSETVASVMLSITFRMGAAVLLTVAAFQFETFVQAPLVIWVVLSHSVLLVADIRLTRQALYPSQ